MGGSSITSLGSVFLVCVGFMDPGKWATALEGGSRFGLELVWLLMASSVFAAVLHSMSYRLGLVTGQNLAQVCHKEFPSHLSTFLWLQCEFSIVILELTMVLGIAMALNGIMGISMFAGVVVTAACSLILLVALPHLGLNKTELFTASVMGVVLLCFAGEAWCNNTSTYGVLIGMVPKLKGENLYIAAGILGANILPYKFYLQSSLVQEGCHDKITKAEDVLHHNIIDIFTGFAAALLINIAVLSSAAAAFHNHGHIIITLQDAQALMEQILSNSVTPVAFAFALLCAGQISTFMGIIGGQIASEGFVGVSVSSSLHRVLVKAAATTMALFLLWYVGSEGIYQVVIFSQVILALQLPSAIVPLVKVTSSVTIMGNHKNSMVVETVSWLGVGLIFLMDIWVVFDMFFGESDEYMGSGSWNLIRDLVNASGDWGELVHILLCIMLLGVTTLWTLVLMWIVTAPSKADDMKSYVAGSNVHYHTEPLDKVSLDNDEAMQDSNVLPTAYELSSNLLLEEIGLDGNCVMMEAKSTLLDDMLPNKAVPAEVNKEPLEMYERDLNRMDVQQELTPKKDSALEISSGTADLIPADDTELLQRNAEEQNKKQERDQAPDSEQDQSHDQQQVVVQAVALDDDFPLDESSSSMTSSSREANSSWSVSPSESALETNGSLGFKEQKDGGADASKEAEEELELLDKDDYDMEGWENLEQDDAVQDTSSAMGGSVNSLTFEEPGSGRSFSARSDTSEGSCGGSGSGSFSRLSGLGRSARRQYAALLDEFWGKLYDLHGQSVSHSHGKSRAAAKGSQTDTLQQRGLVTKEMGSSYPNLYSSKYAQKSWSKAGRSDLPAQVEPSILSYPGINSSSSSFSDMQIHDALKHSSQFDTSAKRYSSLRYPSQHGGFTNQYATFHGYKAKSYVGRSSNPTSTVEASPYLSNRQQQSLHSPSDIDIAQSYAVGSTHSLANSQINEHINRSSFQSYFPAHCGTESPGRTLSHSMIADKSVKQLAGQHLYAGSSWNSYKGHDSAAWDSLVYRATGELDMSYSQGTLQRVRDLSPSLALGQSPIGGRGSVDHNINNAGFLSDKPPLSFDEISPSQSRKDGFSIHTSQNHSLWATQPFQQLFGPSNSPVGTQKANLQSVAHKIPGPSGGSPVRVLPSMSTGNDQEIEALSSLRSCLRKLLRLDGSDWLFRFDSGSDEDLIGRVAERERVLLDADTRELHKLYANERAWSGNSQRSLANLLTHNDRLLTVGNSGVPHCGEGCVWNLELVISFGVWCIHRVLELALMESRPELWGKYTYVLNRLQGVLDPAFSKPRNVSAPCLCVISETSDSQAYVLSRQGSLTDVGIGDAPSRGSSNGILGNSYLGYPQSWPWGRNTSTGQGKGASSAIFLEIIKEVETAIECRKGRTGTAAGDVAFPKGKENLASVLKRYKRRLSNRSATANVDSGINTGAVRSHALNPLFLQHFYFFLL